MTWRGSAEHIDANVPDYQKMLQGRYTASGWSSIPSIQSSYASTSHSTSHAGHYLNTRPPASSTYDSHRSGSTSQQHYLPSYQPSKYGLTSYNRSLESNLNTLEIDDDSPYLADRKAYIDKNYGIMAREFDLGPFRSKKETDYSSDSGTRRARSRQADYSSDSGMGYRRQRPKSAEFDVDLPSPDATDRAQHDDFFSSPIKSQINSIDDVGHTDNQSLYTSDGNSAEHYQNYSPRTAPVTPSNSLSNNHNPQTVDRPVKTTSQLSDYGIGKDSQSLQRESQESHENNSDKLSFFSPPLYKGDVSTTSLGGKDVSSVTGADDLTNWQRQQQQGHRDGERSNGALVETVSPRESSSATYRQYLHREKNPKHGSYSSYGHDSFDGEEPSSARSYSGRAHSPRRHHGGRDQSPRGHTHHAGRDHSPTGSAHHHHHHHKSSSKHINLPAAETLIRDKDAIIEDLKGELDSKLDMIKKYEAELLRAQTARRGGHTDLSPTFSKMQELEYRNAELRTELTKIQKQKNQEIEELEIKLGGAEHEVDQLKHALKKSQPNLMDMKNKMFEREAEVEEWKGKCAKLTKNYEALEEKVGGLERYLSDLPTIEEFTKTAEELASCREENDLKSEQIEALEKRLMETTQMLSERETTIHELEDKQQQLGGKMRELSSEIQHIRSGGDGKALYETREQLKETREIKDRATQDLEKAKKLLEMNHRRLRQAEAKHKTELRDVQERLDQEETSVMALREEVIMKEEHIEGLKKSMKELASQKQELRNETLVLKEQLQQVESLSDDDHARLQRRVIREMSNCFTELNDVTQIIIQRADGKDPNVSLLLGMKGMTLDDDDQQGATGGDDEQSLQHWLAKVKELRGEVERIRNIICNKYAEEMGDNLNCATQ